jgi:predicted NBD/HSP70 family sugar kinase
MYRGELFRGADGLAPDLGGMLVGGLRLGAIASEAAILSQAQAVLNGAEHGAVFRTGRGMAAVVAAAQAEHPAIIAILEAAGEALGLAIANLIAVFAPRMVVLAGEAIGAGGVLLDALRAAVTRLLPQGYAPIPELAVHRWSEDSWARGAAALTLRDLYGAPWNTTGPARAR